MKEKLDLSLDNRQIVSLLVASIVVMGAVFVLGVVVGKKLSESGRTETATDLLAALDQKKEAMEKAETEPKPELTFQKVLTTPTPAGEPEVRVVTLAPPRPVEVPKPVEAEPREEEAHAAPTPAPVVDPKPAVAKVTEPAKTETASARAPAGKVEPATVATSIKKTALSEAIARAQKPTAPVPSHGNYTLQLAAQQSRAEADRFAQNLKAKGYAPYIVEAEVPGKGTWYRIRLGRFPSKDSAQNYLKDFRRETQLEGFVTTN